MYPMNLSRRKGKTIMRSLISADHLCVYYGQHAALRDITFSLREGQWLMLAGPNGAGKSTLLGAISRNIPFEGSVRILDKDIARYGARELARNIGVLFQSHQTAYAFTVREIVTLGRYAYGSMLRPEADIERTRKVEEALALTGLTDLADRSVLELSGGELQRTFLAQLFAQDPAVMILDEPANHLDPLFQKQIFTLLSSWLDRPGHALITVVHDLGLAMTYGTDALLLKDGQIAALGSGKEIFTREVLRDVYDMDVAQWMQQLLGAWQRL